MAGATPDWASLKEKGFVVARGLLSEEQVAALCAEYRASGESPNRNYDMRNVSAELTERLAPTLLQAAAHASAGGVDADTLYVGVYISVNSGPGFSQWHQDHESYYLYQNHEHYLNVWIPIIKPDPHRSNLSIVPFDALKARAPALHDRLVGRGAGRFETIKGRYWWIDDADRSHHALDFHLDELATAPELAAGDALVMRGDACHRRQDGDTQRVAVSFRVLRSESRLTRERLVRGGLVKYIRMMRAPHPYAAMLNCFRTAGRNDITVGQFLEMTEGGRLEAASWTFPFRLLAEKVRASMS